MRAYLLICLTCISLLSAMPSYSTAARSISPRTYEILNDIQEYISKNKLSQAKEELNELQEDLNKGLGLALTYQLLAQVALIEKNTPKAIKYFQQALQQNAFNPLQNIALNTSIAQLYLSENQAQKSINTLKPLLTKNAKNTEIYAQIKAPSFITLGAAYQLKEQFKASIFWLKEGIKRQQPAKENWLQMLMAAYYHTKDYARASEVVKQIIQLKPKKETYWQQLASLYQLQNDYRNALTTLELAHSSGILSKPASYLLLVQLLIRYQTPERGGRILESAIKKGIVKADEKQWKLLANALHLGKERSRAIAALEQAAKSSKDGELLFRAGQLAYAQADYPKLISLLERAIKKGLKSKHKGRAYLFMGSAAFELKQPQQARAYFLQAEKIASSSISAKNWLNYLQALTQ